MAYIPGAALYTRLREVLDDGAGDYRTITSTRFGSGLYEGLDIPAQTLRALVNPIVEASVVSIRRSPDSPPALHSLQLYEVDVEVTVVRAATLNHKLSTSARDALKGAALVDADALAQALQKSGNLSATTAGTSTGLITGLLMYTGDSSYSYELGGETSARIESTHKFTGVLRADAATS